MRTLPEPCQPTAGCTALLAQVCATRTLNSLILLGAGRILVSKNSRSFVFQVTRLPPAICLELLRYRSTIPLPTLQSGIRIAPPPCSVSTPQGYTSSLRSALLGVLPSRGRCCCSFVAMASPVGSCSYRRTRRQTKRATYCFAPSAGRSAGIGGIII